MRLSHNKQTHDGFGQLRTGLPATGGLAAGAQTQISPGASALAVPRHRENKRARFASPGWVARSSEKSHRTMDGLILLAGVASLLTGLHLLEIRPLVGVLSALAGMGFCLDRAAHLCRAHVGIEPIGSMPTLRQKSWSDRTRSSDPYL